MNRQPTVRQVLADAVETLIDVLDLLEPDADAEDGDHDEDGGDTEPSLGAIERHAQPVTGGPLCPGQWRDRTGDQSRWASGGVDDLEDEHDGREPEGDREPSLGSINPTISGSQGGWASGGTEDLEAEIVDQPHDGEEGL